MSGARSILFVEDEAPLREMVVEALQDAGYHVQAAEDGIQALDFIGGSAHFDAMITDVSMPNGVSGIELARKAKDTRPGLVVVLVSGFARGQLPPVPHAIPFLPKPYRLGELMTILRESLDDGDRAGN